MLLPISPFTMPTPSAVSSVKPKKPSSNPSTTTAAAATTASAAAATSITNSSASPFLLCKHHHHSPSATTLDLLILLLVLFSSLFLVSSLISHLVHSLSLLLPSSSILPLPLPLLLSFIAFAALSVAALEFCCPASRRCSNPRCKGLKKCLEFDIQLQTEDCLHAPASKEIDDLPWKGGAETNPDYECLRSELRRMAPPNGRAVLLFRSRCGCAVAKLEAWGPKRGRRHKK